MAIKYAVEHNEVMILCQIPYDLFYIVQIFLWPRGRSCWCFFVFALVTRCETSHHIKRLHCVSLCGNSRSMSTGAAAGLFLLDAATYLMARLSLCFLFGKQQRQLVQNKYANQNMLHVWICSLNWHNQESQTRNKAASWIIQPLWQWGKILSEESFNKDPETIHFVWTRWT